MASEPDLSIRERRFGKDASLRRRTARGTLVNGGFVIFVNALAILRGFVVAGFLSTPEYGVWGIIVVIAATLIALKQVGIGEKFVQQDDEDQERAFHLAFTFELIVSTGFAVLGAALMFAAAAIYDAPQIVVPGIVLMATLPLQALQMPLVVFYRRMNFAKQRLLQGIDPVVGFAVAVPLAASGAGYWSIVAGTVAGSVSAAALALLASPYPLKLALDGAQARSYLSFSWPIFVGALSMAVVGQGTIAAGKATVGLAGLGVIVLTTTISQFADRADKAITDTMYPAICAVKDRADLLFESFVTSNRIALMWAIPFGVGVALFSEDILVRVLGPEWRPGVTLLQATAVATAVHQVGFNWQAFYRATDRTKPIAWGGVVGIVTFLGVVMPSLLTGGLDGLAIGLVGAEVVYLAFRMVMLTRLFPALKAVRHLWRALAPSLPAAIAVLAVRQVETGERDLWIALGEAVLYGLITLVATQRLERNLIGEAISYLRPGREPEPVVNAELSPAPAP